MIKMMILAPRRPELTHQAFRNYLINVHAPLVRAVTEVSDDIRAYYYNFRTPDAVDTALGHPAAPFDVFSQIWFDSIADQVRGIQTKRYIEIVRPDEERFADGANARFHYMREVEIIPGDVGEHKLFYLRRRRPNLSRAEFQARWQEAFPRALQGSAAAERVIKRYVQNQTLPEEDHRDGDDPRYFDVIDEFAITGPDAWGTLAVDPELRARIAEVERELLDTDRTWAYFSETLQNI